MKTSKISLKNNFTPYPETRDSGIDWIGKVPVAWRNDKISSVFDFPKDKVSDKDFEPLSVTYGGIKKQIETAVKSDDGTNRKKVLKGDIAINGRSDRKGAVGMSEYDGSISLVYHVLRKRNPETDTKYFHYLFRSKIFSEEFYRWGRGIVDDLWTTRSDEMKRISVPVPPVETQKKIATYLDEKTALIDQIIERKKRLIELLREKRTAVINQAVTKGLDPDVLLVDSGIDWIGKIPKGWKRQRLGYEVMISVGSKDVNEGNPEGIYPFFSCSKERTFSDGYSFDKEALLVAGNGEVGMTQYYKGKFEAYQRTYVLWGFRNNPHYFKYYISTLLPIALLDQFIGSVINYIKRGDLLHFPVLIPSQKEQEDIVCYLDNQMASIDILIEKIERSVGLFQEFKSSLISSFVTGKIKV